MPNLNKQPGKTTEIPNLQHSQSLGSTQVCSPQRKGISLKLKLWVGLAVIFSSMLAGSFYWFYRFTTDRAIQHIRQDLHDTLQGAAAGIDVDQLMDLYREGQPNPAGFSNDPRYLEQMAWFELVHSLEPRAWPYSYVVGNQPDTRRLYPEVPNEKVILVDLWANYNSTKAAFFLENISSSEWALKPLVQDSIVERPGFHTNRWGQWMTSYLGLKDSQDQVVAVLGIDIEADYVIELKQTIQRRILLAFSITCVGSLLLIYGVSSALVHPLQNLKTSAFDITEGKYESPEDLDLLQARLHAVSHSRATYKISTMLRAINRIAKRISRRRLHD